MPQKIPMKRKWVTLRLRKISRWICESPRRFAPTRGIRRDSAVLFNLSRESWERKGWSDGVREESTIFPIVESFDDSCYILACDSIRRRAKPSLSNSATPVRQVIQIELLRKFSLCSSISLSLYLPNELIRREKNQGSVDWVIAMVSINIR